MTVILWLASVVYAGVWCLVMQLSDAAWPLSRRAIGALVYCAITIYLFDPDKPQRPETKRGA